MDKAANGERDKIRRLSRRQRQTDTEHRQAAGERSVLYINHVSEARGELQPGGTELGVVRVLRCLG